MMVFKNERPDKEDRDVIQCIIDLLRGGLAAAKPIKTSNTSATIQIALRHIKYGFEIQWPIFRKLLGNCTHIMKLEGTY